jgi:hypothetical protein
MAGKKLISLIVLLTLFLCLSITNVNAHDSTNALEMVLFPAELNLQNGESQAVILYLNNTSDHSINEFTFSLLPAENSLDFSCPDLKEINPKTSQLLSCTLSRQGLALKNEKFEIVTTYHLASKENPHNEASNQKITIGLKTPTVLNDLAKIEINPKDIVIREAEQPFILIEIQNVSEYTLEINSLEIRHPSFIGFSSSIPSYNLSADCKTSNNTEKSVVPLNLSLKAYEIREIPMTACLFEKGTLLGQQAVILEFDTNWTENKASNRSGILRKTLSINVESFAGSSSIISVLGVPSFFLLPGFLMISIFLLFWSLLPHKIFKITLEPKSINFWVLSVSLSLLFTWISSQSNNLQYFTNFTMQKILKIWANGIMWGFLLFILMVIAEYVLVLSEKNPRGTDSPLTIFRKMKRNKTSFPQKFVLYKSHYYWIFNNNLSENVWIVPTIQCKYFGNTAENDQARELIDNIQIGIKPAFSEETKQELDSLIKLSKDFRVKFEWKESLKPIKVDIFEVDQQKNIDVLFME